MTESVYNRPRLSELVVVEGLHDKQAVEVAVDADIWVLGGFRIGHTTLEALRRAVSTRGVILLTDPDGAGERIRQVVAAAVPGCQHAFIPRASAKGAHGIGVEHANPEAIRQALLNVRGERTSASTADDGLAGKSANVDSARFILEDLISADLAGAQGAAHRRILLGEKLGIGGGGNAKAFLHKLNVLGITREEWHQGVRWLEGAVQDGE